MAASQLLLPIRLAIGAPRKFQDSMITKAVSIPLAAALALSAAFAISASSAHAAACKFEPVKHAIDNLLDKDAAKGAIFRHEVADGADSITMVEKLVPPDVADMADICRFQVGEYLTKRGYPPFH